MKTLPLSVTMESGVPKLRIIFDMKISASCGAVMVFLTGMYLTIFVYRSTMVRMLSKAVPMPVLLGGNPVIKSIVMSDHGFEGLGKGCISP